MPHASLVFCTLLLVAEMMKLEISVSAENPEHFQTSPWIAEAYGEQWFYVASQQFLQHYFPCKVLVTSLYLAESEFPCLNTC